MDEGLGKWWHRKVADWAAGKVLDIVVIALLAIAGSVRVAISSWAGDVPWYATPALVLSAFLLIVATLLICLWVRDGLTKRTRDYQSRDIAALFGTWHVSFTNGYAPDWTFEKDGFVSSTQGAPTGKWTAEDTLVRIKWDHPTAWETLQRPIVPCGTAGGSWMPNVSILAKKLVCGAS